MIRESRKGCWCLGEKPPGRPQSQKRQNDLCSFPRQTIQYHGNPSNAEESEVEQFYEDLQDLLELTPKKDVLFIIGDWNA